MGRYVIKTGLNDFVPKGEKSQEKRRIGMRLIQKGLSVRPIGL